MISTFLNFEWKHFFRSMFWQKGILINIIMGFFALYFIAVFLGIGIGGYYVLQKQFPLQDPLTTVNSVLLFVIIFELIIRYIMQKLPVMNIKPMLLLPIRKNKLINYVLIKSVFSFFNIINLFFYIPFAIVLIKEGYSTINVMGWLIGFICIVLSLNYLNFLINKSKIALSILATLLIGTLTLQYYGILNLKNISLSLFNGLYDTPIFLCVPFFIAISFYFLNFTKLKSQLYLDDVVSEKIEEANSTDLSFINRFGSLAPFLKNDMRLIWRNKRPRTILFMSFIFLLYAIIFFSNDVYEEEMPSFLVFAALFVTGGFILNFGQFIPAWDSSYYKMIMSQNISYRKFLESKWLLMVTITFALYILSIPYLLYGLDKFLLISAGAIFNIGFNSLFLVFSGSFNRKRIDLDKGAFGNTQGMSATQFIIIIPMMGIPMFLFWIFNKLMGFNAGVIAIAIVGIIAFLFKDYFMTLIEKKYIKNKYATIHAFNQSN